ncbi:MAG: glycosyltransferase family 4 protein [Steroidobacteraceae bacterium]
MSSKLAASAAPRIYYLTEEFYPPQIGGVELMVSYLSHGLAARGLSTQVITRQPSPPVLPEETIGCVRVRRIRPGGQMKGIGWRALPAVLSYLWRLALILLSESGRYDVVIVSGLKIIPLAAIPVCRLLGKRCIIRIESTFELAEPLSAESLRSMGHAGWLLHGILRRTQRYVLSRAEPVVAISREVENMLLRLGVSPARIARIPNGIDLRRFQPASPDERAMLRARLGLPETATLVLFAGRLSRAKGIVRLLEVWPQIIARHPTLHLLIVGSGAGSFDDCEEELASRIREPHLQAHATMIGATSHVQDYLRAADVFMFPSLYEGFGLGIVEALACGMIVAVTPVGVAAESIQHGVNGFLFRADDSEALVKVMDEVLASTDSWPAIGGRARATVAPFDLEAIVGQYAELCRTAHP